MPVVHIVANLDLDSLPNGAMTHLRLDLVRDGMGEMIRLPVIVATGVRRGPVVGFTAAVHGNELNGVRAIQRLMALLDPMELAGTVVAVPVVNVPGFLTNRREFNDNADLNRVMPGLPRGTNSQVYAHRFVQRVVVHLDYLLDLHTASFGRINSLYVRANMSNAVTARMAYLQQPEMIVHNSGGDGTLRAAAAALGVHAITVELGDPQSFQKERIKSSVSGALNVLTHFGVIPARAEREPPTPEPIQCGRSYWIYTDRGGLLDVFPEVGARVRSGDSIARVTDMFGGIVAEYQAPEDGVVIGKSVNPVNQAGSRILHLGIEGLPDEFPDPSMSLTSAPLIDDE